MNEIILQWEESAFTLASYLTDPVCKAHENFRRIQIVDDLYQTAGKIERWAQKVFLGLGLFAFACLAALTSVPAIALRSALCQIQKNPFIYKKGEAESKKLMGSKFSLFFWNVCCIGGGYAISDGGVVPWADRIESICSEIMRKDADVVCLCEVPDIQTAQILYEKMKKEYAHFYYNIGPRAVGISSGIMVASKFEITDPEFTAFPKEMLVDRTKNAEKGVFAFDVQSENKSFARIFTTHLQHSEECAHPSPDEVTTRRLEMELIMEKVDRVKGKAAVVVGDLNLDDEEYNASAWSSRFQKGDDYLGRKTWEGDEYYAKLVGNKRISGPLNLDHAMIVKGTAKSIRTTLSETGYDPKMIKQDVSSDHKGLCIGVTLNPVQEN